MYRKEPESRGYTFYPNYDKDRNSRLHSAYKYATTRVHVPTVCPSGFTICYDFINCGWETLTDFLDDFQFLGLHGPTPRLRSSQREVSGKVVDDGCKNEFPHYQGILHEL